MSVSGVFKILRRLTGAVGPVALQSGQLFINQVDNILYVGYGDDGSGNSTSQVGVGGVGAFVDKASTQTIAGAKTFQVSPQLPSPSANDSSANAAPTSWVQTLLSGVASLLAPKANPTFTGTVAVPTALAGDNSMAAANTSFVQNALSALAQGLQTKPTAKAATAAALPSYSYSNGVITASANGGLNVDGVTSWTAGVDAVLVLNETGANQAYNGLYVVTNAGGSGASFVLTRHADMNSAAEFSGAFVPVGNAAAAVGGKNANSLWLCNPSGAVTVGTTAIPFTQLNGATDLLQSAGITISGNTISVAGVGSVASGSLFKWSGSSFVAAVAGTDYVAPGSTYDSGTA